MDGAACCRPIVVFRERRGALTGVRVELGSRSYEIRVGSGQLAVLGETVAQAAKDGRALVVTDRNVAGAWAEDVVCSLRSGGLDARTHVVAPGERSKSLRTLEGLYGAMVEARLTRDSVVVAMGGGVVGDLGGFAAATFLRGISCVQVPTSLLAMVDSSVGGKTGVNLGGAKNLIGAFAQPAAVVCDPLALRTLPARELRSGLAEAIKHGIIRDPAYLSFIEGHLSALLGGDAEALAQLVEGSCRIKAAVVAADERETGLRRILNYGHTFGHGFETAAGLRRLRHGEAIAVGMVCASELSVRLGLLSQEDASRVVVLLRAAGLPTSAPGLDPAQVLAAMELDKKAGPEGLRFVVCRAIGEAEVISGVDGALVEEIVRDAAHSEA